MSSVRVTVCRMHFRILFFAPRHVPLIGLPPHVYSMSWSPLFFFFSLSIFEPVIVFPPRLCVSAFFIFFTPLIFRVRLQPQTDLVCMLAPPTPRGVYIKGECGALSSSPDLCDSPCRVGIGRCYSNSARGRRCLTDRKYVFFFCYVVSVTRNVSTLCVIVYIRRFYFSSG